MPAPNHAHQLQLREAFNERERGSSAGLIADKAKELPQSGCEPTCCPTRIPRKKYHQAPPPSFLDTRMRSRMSAGVAAENAVTPAEFATPAPRRRGTGPRLMQQRMRAVARVCRRPLPGSRLNYSICLGSLRLAPIVVPAWHIACSEKREIAEPPDSTQCRSTNLPPAA